MSKLRNLITDVPGVKVGNATDHKIGSGVTAVVFDEPAIASVDLRGGGVGTREVSLLDPAATVQAIDAITLSGGSAFGLESAAGVMASLAEHGRGYAIRSARVPIVPGAILFDLLNGGDKNWGRFPPYRELGHAAAEAASIEFELGSVGAGTGALTENIKGGLGSASAMSLTGHIVGAIVAVNAVGRVTVGDGPHFWAAPFEQKNEFGGLGFPEKNSPDALIPHLKGAEPQNTTLAIIATDAELTKAQAARLASIATTGLARSIWPIFTPLDGDIVFAASTARRPLGDQRRDLAVLGATAAACLARAVARGVYEAKPLTGTNFPTWHERFGKNVK